AEALKGRGVRRTARTVARGQFEGEVQQMRWWAAVTAGIATAALTGGVASAATLSVTTRLQDRREVASGTRAYAIGFEDGRFYARALQFRDDGALPGAPEHHYAALVGANAPLLSHRVAGTGGAFRGNQGNRVCTGSEPAPGKMPSECDDGPFGKGTGGQLTYRVHVPADGTQTLWVAVAGSDDGVSAARQQFARALR